MSGRAVEFQACKVWTCFDRQMSPLPEFVGHRLDIARGKADLWGTGQGSAPHVTLHLYGVKRARRCATTCSRSARGVGRLDGLRSFRARKARHRRKIGTTDRVAEMPWYATQRDVGRNDPMSKRPRSKVRTAIAHLQLAPREADLGRQEEDAANHGHISKR